MDCSTYERPSVKPCLEPGCPNVTCGARCGEHRRQEARVRLRPPRRLRGYDENWYRAVRAAIARQPWCSRCGTAGSKDNPLTGDHPVPLSAGGAPDQDPVVLCRKCNSAKGSRV